MGPTSSDQNNWYGMVITMDGRDDECIMPNIFYFLLINLSSDMIFEELLPVIRAHHMIAEIIQNSQHQQAILLPCASVSPLGSTNPQSLWIFSFSGRSRTRIPQSCDPQTNNTVESIIYQTHPKGDGCETLNINLGTFWIFCGKTLHCTCKELIHWEPPVDARKRAYHESSTRYRTKIPNYRSIPVFSKVNYICLVSLTSWGTGGGVNHIYIYLFVEKDV